VTLGDSQELSGMKKMPQPQSIKGMSFHVQGRHFPSASRALPDMAVLLTVSSKLFEFN
jgi:hypothetical protein